MITVIDKTIATAVRKKGAATFVLCTVFAHLLAVYVAVADLVKGITSRKGLNAIAVTAETNVFTTNIFRITLT